jgi:hypothetical protein
MTLQTYEEQEILARVRRCEELLILIAEKCADILQDVQPRYTPTKAITVTAPEH